MTRIHDLILAAVLLAVLANAGPVSELRSKLGDVPMRLYLQALHMDSAYNFHLTDGDPLVNVAAWAIARLGGWTGYYGKPGPRVMRRGLDDFQRIKYGTTLGPLLEPRNV